MNIEEWIVLITMVAGAMWIIPMAVWPSRDPIDVFRANILHETVAERLDRRNPYRIKE